MVDCASFSGVTEEQIQRQLDIEESLIDRGIQQYRIALVEKRNDGHMADSMPGRWLSANFLERVSMEIRKHIGDSMRGEPGRDVAGVPMLTQMEPDVYAYIALRDRKSVV